LSRGHKVHGYDISDNLIIRDTLVLEGSHGRTVTEQIRSILYITLQQKKYL